MKAVYISEFGSLDRIGLREIETSQPAADEVQVKVHAAGVNRADLLQALGRYPPPSGFDKARPGLEFAGEITGLSQDVDGWRVGQKVFGITAGHGQAEFLTTAASQIAEIPANLSFTEAAAIPEAFITAHDALFTIADLKAGETVLIHAVASGVGLAALQLAKAAGAMVIGTSRTASKLEKCAAYGLGLPVQTNGADFAAAVAEVTLGRGVDVIVDLVGAGYFEQNLAALALKGRMVLVGLTSGSRANFEMTMALQKRATIVGTVLRSRSSAEKAEVTRSFIEEVLPLFVSGKIKPVVDRVWPAEQVKTAYQYLQSNESFGKVVLEF